MARSISYQAAIVVSVFLLPIITYLLYKVTWKMNSGASPLPPPTEITNLFIYPIKSCHGISVLSAELLPTGLDLDRQWMWVTGPNESKPYEFLTIRNMAKMTLIRPSYNEDVDTLTVTAPAPNSIDEKLEFTIPAHPSEDWLSENTTLADAHIWSKSTPAHCFSAELTSPFNAFFGKDVRLVYKSPTSDSPRMLGSNGATKYLGRDASTCFPDLMPILVGCESSIDELNSRLRATNNLSIDVRRFRPNILVRGGQAWDEDRWKTLQVGGITLDVTQRCARCHVPNVDPETAEEHKRQPWDTLMKYRRVDEGIKFKPCFGMLCVPRGEGGGVKVGMQISVSEVTGDHKYMAGF